MGVPFSAHSVSSREAMIFGDLIKSNEKQKFGGEIKELGKRGRVEEHLGC